MATASPGPRVVRFGAFELDRRAGELRKDGLKVKLAEKPLRLLELLLDRPGEVVTREELRQQLWPADTFVDFDNSINNAVNRVRAAVGDSAESPRFIETLGGRGYRFIAPVQDGGPAEGRSRPTRRRTLAIAGAFVAALLAGGLALTWWERRDGAGTGPIRSLAVLPLANLSGNPDEDYFVDGLTEAVITDLASIRSVRVISRQSVMRYKGSQKPLPEIARELGVDAVVEGSAARSGSRVRVSAQLLYAPGDRHLWAKSYERDVGDLLALQGEVARTIAEEVRATLTPEERSRLARSRTADPEAYDLYLRGRYFFNRRYNDDLRVALLKSVVYLEQAIARDPRFALAQAALAETYVPTNGLDVLPPWEAGPRIREYALKALALDPDLAEARTALGNYKQVVELDWAGAEREFQRALELNPGYPTARLWYSFLLLHEGRSEEALQQTERGLENDPFSLILRDNNAWALTQLGRNDEAISRLQKALELDPGSRRLRGQLARLYLDLRRHQEALAEYEKMGSQEGIALVHAAMGQPEELRVVLARLHETAKQRYVSPLEFASIHTALGEKDRAFAYLDEAYRTRAGSITGIKTTPQWAPLRSDPRFTDLLRRLNLL